MSTKIILGLALAVVIIGGGRWFMQPQADVVPGMTPTPTSTIATTTESKSLTLATVAEHAGRTSCWSAINGMVYDLTTWIDTHPGGADRILKICGKDGSSAFTNKHGGQPKPEEMLASFKIGPLE